MSNVELLETLKKKLVTADDFMDVLRYFFDHFGENPDFIALGKPTRSETLEAVLQYTGSRMLGKPVKVHNLLLIRLPEHGFIHGGFTADGKMGNVFYFEDIQMGLMSVVTSVVSGETKMARITLQAVPTGVRPSLN
ncbi:MAG: hypothetical protein NZT92_05160 [Abditibacteriales bacterium]|nr:hypothetical protein [Abditibacteriales bacterium]MDW8366155.1 hypothetical protein [Abditibacteriales bacterium]